MSKKQRIDKVLSNLGYGSRSELKKICKNGLVKVNGKVINNPGVQVDVENDEIIFDGEKVTPLAKALISSSVTTPSIFA